MKSENYTCLRHSITMAVNNNSSVTHLSIVEAIGEMVRTFFHKHYVSCLDVLSQLSVVFHFPNK